MAKFILFFYLVGIPYLFTAFIAFCEYKYKQHKANKKAEAEAQARKAYNDSLFFLDIGGDCKYFETI